MQIPAALDPAEAIKLALPDSLLDVHKFRDETTLIVKAADIVKVARYLRDTKGLVYNFLSDISSVDYYPDATRPGRFGVCYHLYSMLYNRRLRVKVFLPEDDPSVPSVTVVWPAANWLERESYDLMGITYLGHPDLRRVLLSDDWEGYPQRRDYPLGYETPMFSFNKDEINKYKPYAKE
ncbi:MAG TPA: NADH-quinone oxidoreductase subunit C [Phototrophicaceae bacterium]|nr:NADH-quinone oxidoreductase subunit C [Phototrophicaceae bacterium]